MHPTLPFAVDIDVRPGGIDSGKVNSGPQSTIGVLFSMGVRVRRLYRPSASRGQ